MGYVLRASGRWNRYGEYGCLYTAVSERGAVAEYRKVLTHVGLTPDADAPRDLVTIEVDADPVLDLATDPFFESTGVPLSALTGDSSADLELCRTIADYARSEGYVAIISPSAALPGEDNLNIYIDGRAADLRLDVGSIRRSLNY